MAKRKVKIRETMHQFPDGWRRIWIVSHQGRSTIYYDQSLARQAKAELEKA